MTTVNAEAIRPWNFFEKEKKYTVEASSFGSELITCPVCHKQVLLTVGQGALPRIMKDEEIAGWEGKHSCGTKLTVFND